MWELDHKESWVLKNWCFWTVVLEKTLESPLDCQEIKPVNPKSNQSWIFIGGTDAEAEVPILWPPAAKSQLIVHSDSGKNWGQEEKVATEDEIVGWHHWLNWWTWVWVNSGSSSRWWDREAWSAAVHGSQRVRHDLRDWTESNWIWGNGGKLYQKKEKNVADSLRAFHHLPLSTSDSTAQAVESSHALIVWAAPLSFATWSLRAWK